MTIQRIHQYFPLPGEYVAVGVVGIVIYTVLIMCSVKAILLGIKSKSTKRFFISMIIMSLLEYPRYFALVVTENYRSQPCYAIHIASGIFFFISFSIVCRQWSGLLQLGSYFSAVYGLNGLLISNITFALVDILSIIMCGLSTSLFHYFQSPGYEMVTFIEGVRNITYSVFLAYFGIKLVRRFWHFSMLEQQVAAQKRGPSLFGFGLILTASGERNNVFTKVVLRLTSVLVLTTVCFTSRVCMLMAKMIAIHSDLVLTSPDFAMFGMAWFFLADFIPRAVPSLAFIFLMTTKKPARDQIKSADPHSTDYQFVRLAGDEVEAGQAGTTTRRTEDGDDETEVTLNSIHTSGGGGGQGGVQYETLSSKHTTSQGRSFTVNDHLDQEEFEDEEDDDENGENAIDRFFSILSLSATRPPPRVAVSGNR